MYASCTKSMNFINTNFKALDCMLYKHNDQGDYYNGQSVYIQFVDSAVYCISILDSIYLQ